MQTAWRHFRAPPTYFQSVDIINVIFGKTAKSLNLLLLLLKLVNHKDTGLRVPYCRYLDNNNSLSQESIIAGWVNLRTPSLFYVASMDSNPVKGINFSVRFLKIMV